MSDRRGFTLVSVLVAVMLLAVGLVAVARVQAMAMGAQHEAALRGTALDLARAEMERLRSADPAALRDAEPVALAADGRAAPDGPFRRSVAVEETGPHLVQVTVRVTYPKAKRPVELVTLAYRGDS